MQVLSLYYVQDTSLMRGVSFMKKEQIEKLRSLSRKLVRELGMLQLDHSDSSITPGHWHALIEIEKDPGLTISKLGALLLMSISRVSRLTTSLSKKGLIEFKEGLDKREKYLYLTAEGQATVKSIDDFSEEKIEGAFKFLQESEMVEIINAIDKYSNALEQNRLLGSDIKIATLSTSRVIRKQIMNMISEIQENEFHIPINKDTNICILKAEHYFYYDNSYNFWYAVADNGQIIGSLGLRKINDCCGEIKKFFVIKEYRGTGVAKKLMLTLLNASLKHSFNKLYLGSVDILKAAHNFYEKYGFIKIARSKLPKEFELCELDSVFYVGEVEEVMENLSK